jgi:protein tyrosine phosphatase (PTP) superfamily phosphohydrolase (DUF442 family)
MVRDVVSRSIGQQHVGTSWHVAAVLQHLVAMSQHVAIMSSHVAAMYKSVMAYCRSRGFLLE